MIQPEFCSAKSTYIPSHTIRPVISFPFVRLSFWKRWSLRISIPLYHGGWGGFQSCRCVLSWRGQMQQSPNGAHCSRSALSPPIQGQVYWLDVVKSIDNDAVAVVLCGSNDHMDMWVKFNLVRIDNKIFGTLIICMLTGWKLPSASRAALSDMASFMAPLYHIRASC